ncbi:SPOR domain-containing protein [Jeongeupia wiesaeckerbachi]|uniref:SPOR domain-containing protein n=1 Tax=Jeongeupia wiesaeckerbachi TaxID=3051218 RepID=UPI003D8080C7
MARENISEELLQLRKRARRRLVGAVALVLFSLIVLWTVMDGEPPAALNHGTTSVEIIASAPSASTVAAAAASAPVALVEATPVPIPALPVPQAESSPVIEQDNAALLPGKLVNPQLERKPVPTPKPSPTPATKSNADHHETAQVKDPARILAGLDDEAGKGAARQYYLQLGAYADKVKAQEMIAKLKEADIPAYGETVKTDKGTLTRVRVGPADQAKARSWQQKLDALGVSARLVSK